MSRAARSVRAAALVCVTIVGLLLLSSPTAVGHAALVSSSPADGSTVVTLPTEIVLTFNEKVTTPAFVVVEAPDGTDVVAGQARTDGAAVRAQLDDAGIAGEYRASYRVVSADGHPISGSVYFTVTEGRTVEKTRADDEEAHHESFLHAHRAHFLWGAAGVVAAAALLLWPRRREDKESS